MRYDQQVKQQLVVARVARGWSQRDVADAIGTAPLNVSRWERGVTMPHLYFRVKLCDLFGKTAQELGLARPSAAVVSSLAFREALIDPGIPLRECQLVGRSTLLRQVKEHLCKVGCDPVVAMHGMAGVGKTALAIELVNDADIRSRYPDGIVWASLGPNPRRFEIWSRWGMLLGIAAAGSMTAEYWRKVLHAAIGNRRILFVIDDAWSRADAYAFKTGGRSCGYLLSTRFRSVAQTFGGTGKTVTVPKLSDADAFTLLHNISLVSIEYLSSIVRSVGGLPLALMLMGHYLRTASSGQFRRMQAALARMSDAGERLSVSVAQSPVQGYTSLSPGQALSLRAVFTAAEEHLASATRSAFHALAVFDAAPHCFSEVDAGSVGCSTEALMDLLDACLVERTYPDTYTLHPVVLDYLQVQGQAHERTLHNLVLLKSE